MEANDRQGRQPLGFFSIYGPAIVKTSRQNVDSSPYSSVHAFLCLIDAICNSVLAKFHFNSHPSFQLLAYMLFIYACVYHFPFIR